MSDRCIGSGPRLGQHNPYATRAATPDAGAEGSASRFKEIQVAGLPRCIPAASISARHEIQKSLLTPLTNPSGSRVNQIWGRFSVF
jgi:hypothetical protein